MASPSPVPPLGPSVLPPNRVLNHGAEADTGAMPALIGRVRELAEIDDALAGPAAGRGRLLLVGGAAGIGKSRLADAAVERASDRGFAVAAGFAVDDPGAPALWPWRRVLAAAGIREPLTGLARDGFEPDAGARFQLFASLTDRLLTVAAPAGLLVVLEDLHWA